MDSAPRQQTYSRTAAMSLLRAFVRTPEAQDHGNTPLVENVAAIFAGPLCHIAPITIPVAWRQEDPPWPKITVR